MPSTIDKPGFDNAEIADRLAEAADLLEAQHVNPFRVRAYRQGAEQVRQLTEPVCNILMSRGLEGLLEIPHLGQSLAHTVAELATTGRWNLLSRLRGDVAPERMLRTLPGIGPGMAARIYGHLGIRTLGELEIAAWDGRLSQVPGMGRKRIDAIRDSLAGRFRRGPRVSTRRARRTLHEPPIGELLDIDAEFRSKADRDRLPRIAPRRFNPGNEAWLPILHTSREQRNYTALFSNSARAHELGMIHDWVVIYRADAEGDGQWTVITGQFGDLKGRRIVRGRERECAAYYENLLTQREFELQPKGGPKNSGA